MENLLNQIGHARDSLDESSLGVRMIAKSLMVLGMHDAADCLFNHLDLVDEEIQAISKAYGEEISRQLHTSQEATGNMICAALSGITIAKQ